MSLNFIEFRLNHHYPWQLLVWCSKLFCLPEKIKLKIFSVKKDAPKFFASVYSSFSVMCIISTSRPTETQEPSSLIIIIPVFDFLTFLFTSLLSLCQNSQNCKPNTVNGLTHFLQNCVTRATTLSSFVNCLFSLLLHI